MEQRVVSNRYGYAGTADLLIMHKVHGPCLVDLKTMKCLRTAVPPTGGVPGGFGYRGPVAEPDRQFGGAGDAA